MRFFHFISAATAILSTLVSAQAPSPTGTPAVVGQGTYPRATILKDGSLLGAYTDTSTDNFILTTVKSTNGGASWSALGTVAQGPKATRDIDNPYVHQLSSGRVLCAYRDHDRTSPTAYTFFRITISYSDDNGTTWKFLSTPASDSNPVNGNWEPFLFDALDGSLQLYYSRENAANDQDSLMRTSTTGGATWSSAQTISGSDVQARDGMLGVTRLAAGSSNLIAVFESKDTVNTQLFTVHSVTSSDDGKTWGNRQLVYSPGAGKNAGAPQITRVGSNLVTSFGTDEDGGTWPSGDMKLVISSNGGQSWGSKTLVHGVPAEWTSVLDVSDTTFLAFYESSGTSYVQNFVF